MKIEQYISNDRVKTLRFGVEYIDVFSLYQATFTYKSEADFVATANLISDSGWMINQFYPEFKINKGLHQVTINFITTFYGTIQRIPFVLTMNIAAKNKTGFVPNLPLSSVVLSDETKSRFLEIYPESLAFKKVFDLRLQVSNPTYLMHDLQQVKKYDKPIIMHGFYNREDGLGAHLPNIYEKVVIDFANVSFSRQANRVNAHFSFLNRISSINELALPRYDRDFRWMNFYFSHENIHERHPEIFNNSAFIHVGGLGLTKAEVWEDIQVFKRMKKFGKTYLYLMWESTDIEVIKPVLKEVDAIIVTNNWLASILREKLDKEIHVVEHLATYYDVPSTGSIDKFVFGYSGGLWDRKNVGMIIQSFNKIKSESDVLKIHSRNFVNTPEMLNIIEREISVNPTGIDLKNITLKDEDYSKWWNSINCYVFISNGESYSITPRQALMQGIPVILSKNTAHLDLLDVPGILWVETAYVKKAQFSGDPNSDTFVGDEFVPDERQVVSRMNEIKQNYSYWKEQAKLGGEIIRKRVDPSAIAESWRKILL